MFFKKKQQVQHNILPRHIAIIMDGNGRWAKKRGLPVTLGHSQGSETFRKIVEYSAQMGIQYLTVYAFSTENWKREENEVSHIMGLLKKYLESEFETVMKNNIVFRAIGDIDGLAPELSESIRNMEKNSAQNTGMHLGICLNYGGRAEILHAARQLSKRVLNGEIKSDDINEELFQSAVYTHDMPDVDLVIRTSGDIRISNFLLWQSAYAEYIFTPVLWPDFTREHLDEAIMEFSKRSRRFGGR